MKIGVCRHLMLLILCMVKNMYVKKKSFGDQNIDAINGWYLNYEYVQYLYCTGYFKKYRKPCHYLVLVPVTVLYLYLYKVLVKIVLPVVQYKYGNRYVVYEYSTRPTENQCQLERLRKPLHSAIIRSSCCCF